MNKVAFVIPVYPPHYKYLNFLNNLSNDLEFDIYFVLSYREDYKILETYNFNKVYKVILLEEEFDYDFISKIINKKVIITFKKYYAINILKEQYEYIAAVDSEVEFISIDNIYEKFKYQSGLKKIFGANVTGERREFLRKIIEESAIFFQDNIDDLKMKTYDLTYYFWFSDIPIYDTKITSKFLKYIDFDNYEKFIDKISWYVFDYISYIYYCVLYENYELVNLKNYGIVRNWSMEFMPIETYFEVIDKLSYKPLWLIYNAYHENVQKIDKNDIVMTYHLNAGTPQLMND
jgi:hypothetical protein